MAKGKPYRIYKVVVCKIMDEACSGLRYDINSKCVPDCENCDVYQKWKAGEIEAEIEGVE